MKRWSRHLLVLVSAAMSLVTLADIKPITPDLMAAAIEEGKTARKEKEFCASFPSVKIMTTTGKLARAFSISISTPYCRIASHVFETTRTYGEIDQEVLDSEAGALADYVFVLALPTTDGGMLGTLRAVDGVATVVLRRDQEVIRPLDATDHEVVFANAYGREESHTGKSFVFPIAAFDPALGPLDIVVVADSGIKGDEAVKRISVQELRKLK